MTVSSRPLWPSPLKPGDAIGMIAPSSPFSLVDLEKGIAVYRRHGFRPVAPAEIFNQKGYLAGSDESRVHVVHRLFEDPAIRALVCVRGGFGSMRILERIDWELIARHPKVLVGFSDATALLNAVYHRCGMVTFHGPMAATIGLCDPESVVSFFQVLEGRGQQRLSAEPPRVMMGCQASGPLVGGNLTTLCHMIGTPYAPCFKEHIVFLEERGEAVYRIDRMLTQMRLAGCFDAAKGVALGRFSDCGDPDQVDAVVRDILGDLNIPVLGALPFGHGRENRTLPIGATVTLDTAMGCLLF